MAKKMLIDASHAEETRVVVMDGNRLDDFDFESINKKQLAGNIYLAKVMRVEPSLQAAFVDYGGNRHGFLAFSEIHPDYYQIPKADREALLAAQAAEAAREDEDDDDEADAKPARRGRRSDARRKGKAEDDDRGGERRRGGRRGGKGRRGGGGARTGIRKTRDGWILEREFRIAGGVKVRLAREDDGTEQDFKLADGTRVRLSRYPEPEAAEDGEAEGGADVMAMAAPMDDRVSMDAEEAADLPEEVGGDDREEARAPRKPRLRDYKIQDVIKKRQILLVQIVKEERGSKGAAVTTYLSLAGRYCVLMPNTARGGGISRKITNAPDRKRLKEIAGELEVPKGMGLIVRTAGAQRTKAEIKRDYEYLLRQWEAVRDLTMESIAPALIYEEGSLVKRSIRDLYAKDIDEILVEGDEGYREAKGYMKMLMPSHAKNVQAYREKTPLFIRHQVESHLAAMFNPVVQLKSGGYIVIGITEALVAIDVNSGRSTRESSIEETATKTNLEAADEVARQLRLRDLAGLIVIDFIDMDQSRNNRAVEKRMKDALADDRARLQIGKISGFGLMEMSRQRLRPGMLEASTKPCPSCQGSGLIRSDESLSLAVLRDIEEEGVRGRSAVVIVSAPVGIANFLLNHKRDRVVAIEERYDLRVVIEGDPALGASDYKLTKMKEEEAPESLRRRRGSRQTPVRFDTSDFEEIELDEDEVEEIEAEGAEAPAEETSEDEAEGRSGRRGRRGGRRSRRDREDEGASDAMRVMDLDPEAGEGGPLEVAEGGEDRDEKPRKRRSRGGRKRSGGGERGKMNGREFAEAAATAMLSSRDALDDAMPELLNADAPEAQAGDASEPTVAEAAPVEQAAPPVEAEAEAEVVEAEAAPPAAPVPAEPEPEAELAVAEASPAAAPENDVSKAPPTPKKEGPKRSGWWSR